MIRTFCAALCIFVALTALADERKEGERPTVEEPSIDAKLFAKTKPEDFFAGRKSDTGCVDKLKAAEDKHRKLRKDLRKLIADKKDAKLVQAAEAEWLAARQELLPLVEKCGPCVTRPMTYDDKVRGPKGKEHWYVADGSCFVGKPNQYETASTDLEKLSRYARRQDGFTALLEFAAFDKDGTAIPSDKRLPTEDAKDPTFVFLAMRGDPGIGRTMVWTHLFQAEFRKRDEGRWVVLQTPDKSVTVPEIAEPELKDFSLGGIESSTLRFRVRSAFGTWYITRDGYIRYQNAGDFGSAVPFLTTEGRKMVQDVLYEMVERMRGE